MLHLKAVTGLLLTTLARCQSTHVVVIGAGASGLAAAYKFMENGFRNVTVLEAADRIGGRIDTIDFNGVTIDMGAQWIHGNKGNDAYDIAEAIGIADDPREAGVGEGEVRFYFNNGTRWNDRKTLRILQKLEYDIVDHPRSFPNDLDASWADFFTKSFNRRIRNENDNVKAAAPYKLDLMWRYVQEEESCDDWNDVSFNGAFHVYKDLPGNYETTFQKGKGFRDVLEAFVERIPGHRIQLNSEVQKVVRREKLIEVKTTTGGNIAADYVIVTPSLGYLKKHADNMFQPKLPASKMNIINDLGYGTVNKIILEFDRPWWPTEDFSGFRFAYNDGFQYTAKDARRDWTRFVDGVFRIEHVKKHLLVWVYGAGSREMEKDSDKQIKNKVMDLIRKNLKEDYPNIPEPLAIRVSRWYSNPFIRGSYSFITVDNNIESVFPGNMSDPVGNKIFFAGEGTSHTYSSTVHGAINSGYREANRILGLMKKKGQFSAKG